MNLARILVFSVAICASPISELAQDSRATALIRQDLYEEGHQADRAGNYVTALKKLTLFRMANTDRLAAATSSGEIRFRDSLEAALKRLKWKVRQDTAGEDRYWHVARGSGPQNGSIQTGQGTVGLTSNTAGGGTVQPSRGFANSSVLAGPRSVDTTPNQAAVAKALDASHIHTNVRPVIVKPSTQSVRPTTQVPIHTNVRPVIVKPSTQSVRPTTLVPINTNVKMTHQ
jgi:hypothetical protein